MARASRLLTILLAAGVAVHAPIAAGQSVCFGTVANGKLEGGVKLPTSGKNFRPYSSIGAAVGRTYVHSTVRTILTDAYVQLQTSAPGKTFVYGETGWASGGRIRPHRTHRNGLSVDFMVPVLDSKNRSVPLPTAVTNRYGYDIEFDGEARFEDLRIDFEALGEHLYQLDQAARRKGVGIALVIFETRYLPKLFATAHGSHLKQLPFMKTRPWVRHDEHYHVDFAVKCRPLTT